MPKLYYLTQMITRALISELFFPTASSISFNNLSLSAMLAKRSLRTQIAVGNKGVFQMFGVAEGEFLEINRTKI